MNGTPSHDASDLRSSFAMDSLEPRLFLSADTSFVVRVEHRADGQITGAVYNDKGAIVSSDVTPYLTTFTGTLTIPGKLSSFFSLRSSFQSQPVPQPESPAEQATASTPDAPQPGSDGGRADGSDPVSRVILAEQNDSQAQPATKATSAAGLEVNPSSTAANLGNATRLVFAQPLSAVELAAPMAAGQVARLVDVILADVEIPEPIKQTIAAYTRTFQIAEFGSPLRLLADSVAAFADECASIPLRASQAKSGSAWSVTGAVIAADVILGSYACHRAWQRRQTQTSRAHRTLTPHR